MPSQPAICASARTVTADSVNPLALTRNGWIDVARRAHAPFVEIEIVCSDAVEHRRRVEQRVSDILGLAPPSWEQAAAREYEPWTRGRAMTETAGRTLEESATSAMRAVRARRPTY
jgi:predicted kinase